MFARNCIAWLALLALPGLAQDSLRVEPADSTQAALNDSAAATDSDSVQHRNPWVAAALSAVLPGAGQVYNRQYVKSVLYLGAEAGLVATAIVRYQTGTRYDDNIKRFNEVYESHLDARGKLSSSAYVFRDSVDTGGTVVRDSLGQVIHVDSLDTVTIYRMSRDTGEFKRERYRRGAVNAGAWALGCYVWALMDALEKTGRFESDDSRNPKVAGWLAAVPGLGLGQIYNGKLSKAGMVFMVQSSLAVMSINYHTEFSRCEDELSRLANVTTVEHAIDSSRSFYGQWNTMKNEAFRNRNTYLWYSLFFYLYGIFDAVVDAHLHDFPSRMRLEPDLDPVNRRVGMTLSVGR